ncbi:MAG: DNA-binding protein [Negativicutes bacterium]|nr:DNA-binding protein [Negativicutes bacterium]
MLSIMGQGLGRTLIIRLEPGELLLESIREKCKEVGMRNAAILSAIGVLDKVHYHRVIDSSQPPIDFHSRTEFLWADGPCELTAMQGMIADGHPHFHAVFSDLEKAYSGHLEEGTVVLYQAEVMLVELTGVALERRKNEYSMSMLWEKATK